MKNVLVINGSSSYAHAKGSLNRLLCQTAERVLRDAGFEVKNTEIAAGYTTEAEVEKILWAGTLLYQMPSWWMGPPWHVKKYLDEVFTEGYGRLYENDGRTRSNASKKYGSGGLLVGKKYMLSTTWNAPLQAFTDSEDFFEGKGVDAVYYGFHKAHQFIGLEKLPSFLATDVIKAPLIEADLKRYQNHLIETFS